ncbi:MAG: hypothetical protein GY944_09010 [bacterium]|nr:hypothetical protein [bacterium]
MTDALPLYRATPLSLERLEQHPDGRVRIRFKNAWKDGTHAVLLEPLDFISRLCALIPPPRFHMLRYHGVLAGHSKDRADVIAQRAGDEPETTEPQLCLFDANTAAPSSPPPSRHPWAWLLKRVFAVDVMICPLCEGAMKVVTIANDPDEILDVLGNLPRSRAPPPTGQLQLDFAAA